eukprot:2494175-Rhodomonas_salina.1
MIGHRNASGTLCEPLAALPAPSEPLLPTLNHRAAESAALSLRLLPVVQCWPAGHRAALTTCATSSLARS